MATFKYIALYSVFKIQIELKRFLYIPLSRLNHNYSVSIEVDKMFALTSTDNKPYVVIMNPSNLSDKDYIKTFSISVFDTNLNVRKLALIGRNDAHEIDCAVLLDNKLIVLMSTAITVINLDSLTIEKHILLGDSDCYFSIYTFDDGYIIHGEQEIVKLNIELIVEWRFLGADIFVSLEDSKPSFQLS